MTHAGVHAHRPIDTLARQVALQVRSRVQQSRRVTRARTTEIRRIAAHPTEWREARAEAAHDVHDARHRGRFDRIVTREQGREDRAGRRETGRIEQRRYAELEKQAGETDPDTVYGRTPAGERRETHHRQAHEEAEQSMTGARHRGRTRAWHAAIETMKARYGPVEDKERTRLQRLDHDAHDAEQRRQRRIAARAAAAAATATARAAAAAAARAGRARGEERAGRGETLGQRLNRGLHEYADGSRTLDGDIKKAARKVGDNVRDARQRAAANARAAGHAIVETTVRRPATSVAKLIRNAIVGAGQKILGWESKERDPEAQPGDRDPLAGLARGGRAGRQTPSPGGPDPRAATRAAVLANQQPLTADGGSVRTAERPGRGQADKPERRPRRDHNPAFAH